ncbi:hypothetical protein BGZ60DRAFT_376843 [Tricladium varicosporioides]|nr:hypothetical protein BGZ60DRAFT_376843 [Hymenoscyphus varicosporioides]
MSSKFSLQPPYTVATLPQPIDRKEGRYVVGDVHGGAPGAKKRKRSELAVGIDGEGINLYDISSSRLITSYALPPQSSFTCPPTSIRTRFSKGKSERRTYVSTTGTQAQINLFHDFIDDLIPTSTSTKTHIVEKPSNTVIALNTTATTSSVESNQGGCDLLVVRRDGEIQCLDGETLKEKWTSPASALTRGENEEHLGEAEVEYVQLTNAYAAMQGIFKGRTDNFAIFPQEITEDGFNPDLLILVTRTKKAISSRRFHLIAIPRISTSNSNSTTLRHSVQSLLFADFASAANLDNEVPSFSIQVSSGTLQQLHGELLTTFDLTETGPKQQSSLVIGKAESFLRLSNSSVMVSSHNSLTVYSPKYQSVLANIELESHATSSKRKRGEEKAITSASQDNCKLLTYFPKLGLAVAISENHLIAVQVEGHQDRPGKLRAAGLLIDSLGRAAPNQQRSGREKKIAIKIEAETLAAYLPGSIGTTDTPWAKEVQNLETAFFKGDPQQFDDLMARKFHLIGKADNKLHNGTAKNGTSVVDRRWVVYSLSKIFDWNEAEMTQRRLSIPFYPPNTFLWLMNGGHVTTANIETALRSKKISLDSIPAGDLVSAVVEINPDMDLLLALLTSSYLGASELLSAIRVLMESLEMLGDTIQSRQPLLTNGEDNEQFSGDIEEQLEKLEAEAEDDLELAEYQLGPGSGLRGQALSLALSKLYTCPTSTIIHALQTIFATQEIVCLIYLLRFELARGAWTTKYLEAYETDTTDDDAEVPGNAIVLITSLLNNCVDAIGAGGWLTGGTRLVNGDPSEAAELISSLKLEVSAALEGIEEATYLRGLTSEMIRYSNSVQKALPKEFFDDIETQSETPARKKRKGPINPPIILRATDEQARLLPLGLKAEQAISRLKVGAGGEVSRRTARDIGNLKSKKVGKYTLERIII